MLRRRFTSPSSQGPLTLCFPETPQALSSYHRALGLSYLWRLLRHQEPVTPFCLEATSFFSCWNYYILSPMTKTVTIVNARAVSTYQPLPENKTSCRNKFLFRTSSSKLCLRLFIFSEGSLFGVYKYMCMFVAQSAWEQELGVCLFLLLYIFFMLLLELGMQERCSVVERCWIEGECLWKAKTLTELPTI